MVQDFWLCLCWSHSIGAFFKWLTVWLYVSLFWNSFQNQIPARRRNSSLIWTYQLSHGLPGLAWIQKVAKKSRNLQSVDRLCKIPFKNCGSCLKAVVLIFKYPPQNVKMWVVFGRERVYSWLMHKQLINGQPEYIMNILWIGLLADERVWVVLNTNCPICRRSWISWRRED